MKVDVINIDTNAKGSIDLSKDIFGIEPREDILHRVVNWQLAKRRSGTHKVKNRTEVRGGGKKPFRQKHTGNARAGSIRSPLWRSGGIVFGPVVRSHAFNLQKKVRNLGLKMALSVKAKDKNLFVIESDEIKIKKTKDFAKKVQDLGWDSVLVISGEKVNDNFKKLVNNIVKADVLPTIGLNVYDILNHKNLVLTKDAVELINKRLAK
jgi:large subunit ribosomal protein L4